MTKELKQQFTLKITQANKTQLIVILYEMLLIYLEEGMKKFLLLFMLILANNLDFLFMCY